MTTRVARVKSSDLVRTDRKRNMPNYRRPITPVPISTNRFSKAPTTVIVNVATFLQWLWHRAPQQRFPGQHERRTEDPPAEKTLNRMVFWFGMLGIVASSIVGNVLLRDRPFGCC
jgi:hypothetical protein